jgi:hypothetical protein
LRQGYAVILMCKGIGQYMQFPHIAVCYQITKDGLVINNRISLTRSEQVKRVGNGCNCLMPDEFLIKIDVARASFYRQYPFAGQVIQACNLLVEMSNGERSGSSGSKPGDDNDACKHPYEPDDPSSYGKRGLVAVTNRGHRYSRPPDPGNHTLYRVPGKLGISLSLYKSHQNTDQG